MSVKLAPVVRIDEEKCVNCHACISACPVKYCNDGTGDHPSINHDLCIGCGSCIKACTHRARLPQDDFDEFMEAVASGEKLFAVVAPGIVPNFPDSFLRLNGFLKSLGISGVFDVSFGAELTVKSYLEATKTYAEPMLIAQPCPAIVSYIEIYRPELLRYLAPADSPMAHTVKMVRRFYPGYEKSRAVVISPCIAKRREFDEISLGAFNVTFLSVKNHLDAKGINLAGFRETEFDNPPAERAVLFSSPGGLLRTIEREKPELVSGIRKIEGQHTIYDYLDKLDDIVKKKMNPFLVDCLNCENGCNGGPGTLESEKQIEELDYHTLKRKEALQKNYGTGKTKPAAIRKKLAKVLNKHWEKALYNRSYVDRSGNFSLSAPSESSLQGIYRKMMKFDEKDIHNCSSCGYGRCERMAFAIHNNLNKPENCHYYQYRIVDNSFKRMVSFSSQLHGNVLNSNTLMNTVYSTIDEVKADIEVQATLYEESAAAIEQILASLKSISSLSEQNREVMTGLESGARQGESDVRETIGAIGEISESVANISELIQIIDDIADKTNLLSMNAAIEAAHAGDFGMGFAVVAQEIRTLADKTTDNAKSITSTIRNIISLIKKASHSSEIAGETMAKISEMVGSMGSGIQSTTTALLETNRGSEQISVSLKKMKVSNNDIRKASGKLNDSAHEIKDIMEKITDDTEKLVSENERKV